MICCAFARLILCRFIFVLLFFLSFFQIRYTIDLDVKVLTRSRGLGTWHKWLEDTSDQCNNLSRHYNILHSASSSLGRKIFLCVSFGRAFCVTRRMCALEWDSFGSGKNRHILKTISTNKRQIKPGYYNYSSMEIIFELKMRLCYYVTNDRLAWISQALNSITLTDAVVVVSVFSPLHTYRGLSIVVFFFTSTTCFPPLFDLFCCLILLALLASITL